MNDLLKGNFKTKKKVKPEFETSENTESLEDQFEKEVTTAYSGFDPTANSLHIGNLVQIMMLVHYVM